MIYKLKKIFILFCLLFLTKVLSQWEYKENKSARSIEAIGQLNFNNSNQDSLVLRISKSKKLGLNFSINGIFFKEAQDYYVLFEISERKFKAANSITENESYQSNFPDNFRYTKAISREQKNSLSRIDNTTELW